MLKWTVLPKRDGDSKTDIHQLPTTIFENYNTNTPRQKTKRRRSSVSRKSVGNKRMSLDLLGEDKENCFQARRSLGSNLNQRRSGGYKRHSIDALETDKENQFTSTPIKNSAETFYQLEAALKDVSNLTPKDNKCRRIVDVKSDKKSSPKFNLRVKKKKECLNDHLTKDKDVSNYFKNFTAVDSHIESIILAEDDHCKCSNKEPSLHKDKIKNKTLKDFSASCKGFKSVDIPPDKKSKIKNIEDIITEKDKLNLPGLKITSNTQKLFQREVRMTPLVRKFLDLRFSNVNDGNNSSFLNDMSLDKIVDAILENSQESKKDLSTNTSMIVHADKEENILSSDNERQIDICSDGSSDSGFRSSNTENSHQIDGNFLCKCNNNNTAENFEKTIIQINETFNERCVDEITNTRKRVSNTPNEVGSSKKLKLDEEYTLKRQKCVRRRKVETFRKNLYNLDTSAESKTISPFWGSKKPFLNTSDEDILVTPGIQYENTPLRGCYLENKEIRKSSELQKSSKRSSVASSGENFRRCLSFESPKSDTTSFCESTFRNNSFEVKGSMDLCLVGDEGVLYVTVIRCNDLCRQNGENVNAYVKVSLSDQCSAGSRRRKNAVLQRTAVHSESAGPVFNHNFKFLMVPDDITTKRVVLEVWHRDRGTKTSEFLGCMSFDVKDAFNKKIEGTFRLLPQTTGRGGYLSIASRDQPPLLDFHSTKLLITGSPPVNSRINEMADSQNQDGGCSNNEEALSSLDSLENELKRSTNKTVLSEQQKYADEHLFLKYLELDPTEGPDAIPAATQRKATGNKFGRTPFTQTKKLQRTSKQGFGFSVVWTHPPRIERVEKGLPAERAGILPGDYIIFVDKHNVVVMPEIEILNLIRSYGNQLTLEIFRRNSPRNGSVLQHEKASDPALISCGRSRTDSNVNLVPNFPYSTTGNGNEQRESTHNVNFAFDEAHAQSSTFNVNLAGDVTHAHSSTYNVNFASDTNLGESTSGHSNVNLTGCGSARLPRRPSTICSTNTASVDFRRRKLHLPQVTFSSEKSTNTPEESRRRTMCQLIAKEQQYATSIQFAITRFVSALAERRDLITPQEHRVLFQNCGEILRLTEEILDSIVHEDNTEIDTNPIIRTYAHKVFEMTSAYKKYCSGIKKADCVLANKMKNNDSEFVRFVQSPAIPRRRPDLTTFIHKPLEHYREVLKMMIAIQSATKPKHSEYGMVNQIVHELQVTYKEITSDAGLMEPTGEGRPLLCVQDLENRLVFTKCKPFVLNKPGRQWIFGGGLSRVEGRNIRPYWALLFSDILLFAKVSRDRVLFINEDPIPLSHISDMLFSIRKKDTEFRLLINPDTQTQATSPTVHCGPDLSRTPKKNPAKKPVILRAPTLEMKAVWQNLLQRQILHLNSTYEGSSLSSPMESPDVPITASVVTLQSANTGSISQQQLGKNLHHVHHLQNHQNFQNNNYNNVNNTETIQRDSREELRRHLETLIEHKCKQMGKTTFNGKYNAIHLENWMKGTLEIGPNSAGSPILETLGEDWTPEMLRKRSEELQLIDSHGNMTGCYNEQKRNIDNNSCDELPLDQPSENESPSKSTTTESQVTVRSSPVVPETIPVCRQCHKNCLSHVLSNTNSKLPPMPAHYNCHSAFNNGDISRSNGQMVNGDTLDKNARDHEEEKGDWRSFMLVGLCANPVANLLRYDPFQNVTPNTNRIPQSPEKCLDVGNHRNYHVLEKSNSLQTASDTPDDSPQTEEHPYHSLSSSSMTLRRFGTVPSLERLGSSEEKEDERCLEKDEEGHLDNQQSNYIEFETDSLEDNEDQDDEENLGIDNEAFNHSSILSWTAKAGSYVAEKMSFFERLSEDYRSGGGFFERYLKPNDSNLNGEECQEEETSGGTSGEEIWGTPTSGGDLDDPPNSPNLEEKLSPNHDSLSDTIDDTEFMMDELLMTPPISGAVLRGLLPRRTLEPLIEEDFSESSSSEVDDSSESSSSKSTNLKKGSPTGIAADTCLQNAANVHHFTNCLNRLENVGNHQNFTNLLNISSNYPEKFSFPTNLIDFNTSLHENPRNNTNQEADSWEMVNSEVEMDLTNQQLSSPTTGSMKTAVSCQSMNESKIVNSEGEEKSTTLDVNFKMPRSESYRKIVEQAEGLSQGHVEVNTGFDFFNVRRTERRIHEQFSENQPLLNVFSKENSLTDDVPTSYAEKPMSASKILKDKQMDRRFWKQLSKKKESVKNSKSSA